MLKNTKEAELVEMAKAEIDGVQETIDTIYEKIKSELTQSSDDEKSTLIMELRAGTGGTEAAMFNFELYNMYIKFCALMGWKYETLSMSGENGDSCRVSRLAGVSLLLTEFSGSCFVNFW